MRHYSVAIGRGVSVVGEPKEKPSYLENTRYIMEWKNTYVKILLISMVLKDS
jgi:hypothetical protein